MSEDRVQGAPSGTGSQASREDAPHLRRKGFDPSRGDPVPDDWELEQQMFHACGTAPEEYRGLIRNLWQAYCSMERRAEMAIDGRLPREHVKHLKRGTTYAVLNRTGLLQTNQPLVDGDMLVSYQGEDGQWWHRPPHEFEDGRFERIPAPAIETEGEDAKRLSAEHESSITEGEAPDPYITDLELTEQICLDKIKKERDAYREALRPFAEAVYDLGGVTEVSMTQPLKQNWLHARTLLSQSSEGGETK